MALLQAIVSDLVCWIETALIFVCNGLISALSLVVAGVVAILPPMPNLPPMPSYVQTALSWLAYIFPAGLRDAAASGDGLDLARLGGSSDTAPLGESG